MKRNNYVDDIKRLPIADVTTRLGLQLARTGNSLQGNCPTGHSSKNGKCFSVNIDDNYFNCFHCGAAGDVISLVEIVRCCDFKQAVAWLADEFNIATPDDVGEPADIDPMFYHNAMLYNAIVDYGKYLLHSEDGTEAQEYLINERGIDADALNKTEWILFPPENRIKDHLRQLYPDADQQINKLHLSSYNNALSWAAFPYRNRDGIITGFLKRALAPAGYSGLTNYKGEVFNNVRWHSTLGTSKRDLFNLHRCKGHDTLLIVEGYPDAIMLPTKGLLNVVAVGQGILSKSHLEGLEEFGVKNVILSFDNDVPDADGHRPGLKNTESAVKLLLTKSRINAFVIDPDLLGGCKDPDEFVKANGIDAYTNVMNNAIVGAKWLANRCSFNNDIEKQKIIDDAAMFSCDIINSIAHATYIEALSDKLSMSIDVVQDYFGSSMERAERAKISEKYQKLNAKMESMRRQGDLEGAAKLIETQGIELKNELYKTKIQTVLPLSDRLLGKYQDEKNRTGNLLGFPLTKFKSLCENIDGVQSGLYLIGAETNVGKTAMLTNVSMDLIESNPDVRVVYFSMDDSWNVIANRLLGILTEIDLNLVQRRQTNDADTIKLKNAYHYLMELADHDRLMIKDLGEVSNYDQIEAIIRELSDDNFAVFLDGLFNVEVSSQGKSIREANIERANKLKTLVDSYNVPIVCTAELRKKTREDGKDKAPTIHDFMETGKFGYNANVAWILSSKYADSGLDKTPVTLKYEKNKLSGFKGGQELTFNRNKGIIKETIALSSIQPTKNNGGEFDF
jgi:DNA primase catalytic core